MFKKLLAPVFVLGFLFAPFIGWAVEVGDNAPCVVLSHIEVDGAFTEHCIRDREPGQRYTILEFFLTNCSDCQTNLPVIAELADKVKATTTTRFVALDRTTTVVENYIQEHRDLFRVSVALDPNRDARRAYDVISTPTLFVLEGDSHRVVYRHAGLLTPEDVEHIQHLVAGE